MAGGRPQTPPWALSRSLPERQGALTRVWVFRWRNTPWGRKLGVWGGCRDFCSRLADPGTRRSEPSPTGLWGKWAPVTSSRPHGAWVGLGLDMG